MLIWYFILGVVEELLKVALFFHLSSQSYFDTLRGMRSRQRKRTPYAGGFLRKYAVKPKKVYKNAIHDCHSCKRALDSSTFTFPPPVASRA